jgi:zinc finger protein
LRTVVPGPCPLCDTQVDFIYQTENIPYFSDILIVRALCPSCGYRYTDTQVLSEGEPASWTLDVTGIDDLSIRVVRSMSGLIRIPELGVRIDPGPACEGFVSNVEGILTRVERIVDAVIAWAEPERQDAANALKKQIEQVRAGTMPVTLIIDDPSGNSMIISGKAQKTPLQTGPEKEGEATGSLHPGA